ncbi:MAG TPA: hypothetical protein VMT71_08565 [Syntrophorhabdales bacterium]|nr:hypothetical protein [Syntrophorhabdales bacterium]
MTGANRFAWRPFIGLLMFGITAACALNMASSKLADKDRIWVSGFPKRVGVATIVGNLSAGQNATDRLSRGLVDMGFHVVTINWDVDKMLGQWGRGVDESLPETTRRRLQERYGLEGLFVGMLSQDKGNFINDTRLSLRLIGVPDGKLVWSVDVKGESPANLGGGVKDTAVSAVEKALQSLQKDVYRDHPKTAQEGNRTSSFTQAQRNSRNRSD